MNAEFQPKQGMSTKKKWMIGCGGCLGVVIIGAIALAVLGSMGVNALKEASGSSVKEIFGPSYKPEAAGYMAFGLPLKQGKLRSMAMMISQARNLSVIAFDVNADALDTAVLKSGKPDQIAAYLKKTSEEITDSTRNSSSKIEGIEFKSVELLPLVKGKNLAVGNAVVKASKRGAMAYMPSAVALIPEAGNHMVILVATDPNTASTDAGADFSEAQKSLRDEVSNIVKASELDDRLQ